MNIFILNENPELAARDYCNKHLPKMCVEMLQMLGSAVIRHGATPDMMPLTKKQTPLKGGYHSHPCTIFTGETKDNYNWVVRHALELCKEYTDKYNKIHFCEAGIRHLSNMVKLIPEGDLTHFALAMPDEYRPIGCDYGLVYHAYGAEAVDAYRRYYHSKEFARWDDRNIPNWWMGDAQ